MKVAIANRGEVALRIHHTLKEMGHDSLLLYAQADAEALATRHADEAVQLQGQSLSDTYLNIDQIVDLASNHGAGALHPGFGFLSENLRFVEALDKAKLIFVGPKRHSMAKLGEKTAAKRLAQSLGVPTLPAYLDDHGDDQKLAQAAQKIGFPILLKPAAGGGGKGMKIVRRQSDWQSSLDSARREAMAAFGDRHIMVEKLLESPRHIEVQIFGQRDGRVLHVGERDCSTQRRYQKIIEESPAPLLDRKLRGQLLTASVQLAEAAAYQNAGTMEFLVEGDNFYFMECNTRLQVEHPVSELCSGLDLVRWQLETALDPKCQLLDQQAIQLSGHAIEARVYAEEASNQFLPSTGTIEYLQLPLGPGRRFDFGVDSGDVVSTDFDPMLGKIIVHASNRQAALQRLQQTLSETIVFGVHTNIEFLQSLIAAEAFQQGRVHTQIISQLYSDGYQPTPLSEQQQAFADEMRQRPLLSQCTAGEYASPWFVD